VNVKNNLSVTSLLDTNSDSVCCDVNKMSPYIRDKESLKNAPVHSTST